MKKYPLISLVLANLVPAVGVLFFGWDLFSVLFMYWLESAVVGIYNIPKMWLAKNQGHRLSGVIFFIIHYSGFMAGHLFFIFAIAPPENVSAPGIALGALSLLVSHGISFRTNFLGNKEYQRVSISEQMGAPYDRIMVMHITIIALGFLVSLTGAPEIALVVLVLIKIGIDVSAHVKEHRKLAIKNSE